MTSVIVFGPTGQIGSAAALTAAENGAKVWLAMRNTSKDIPGLDKTKEEAGNFARVQADLSDPESLSQAIKISGAKRAFLYLAHESSDHMKGAAEALKAAGVTFVVFVSSFTVPTNKALRDTPQSEVIPFVHAHAEASLIDVFGEDHVVALRPGAFASNLFQHTKTLASGEAKIYGPDFISDNISPRDIGNVGGTILVSGPRNGQKKVYLYGPAKSSFRDSVTKIGEMVGKPVKVVPASPEEALETYKKAAIPEFFAQYLLKAFSSQSWSEDGEKGLPNYDEGVKNVELYTGKPATTLEQWIKENEALFA